MESLVLNLARQSIILAAVMRSPLTRERLQTIAQSSEKLADLLEDLHAGNGALIEILQGLEDSPTTLALVGELLPNWDSEGLDPLDGAVKYAQARRHATALILKHAITEEEVEALMDAEEGNQVEEEDDEEDAELSERDQAVVLVASLVQIAEVMHSIVSGLSAQAVNEDQFADNMTAESVESEDDE